MRIEEAELESKKISLARDGNMEAMWELIERHLPLINVLASRLHAPYMEKEALIQAGTIGFMQAVKRYRPETDTKLITYAVPWILGEMKKAIRKEATSIYSLEGMTESEEISQRKALCRCEGVDLTAVDLRMALEKLNDDLKLVICLRYFRDKTQKETALLLRKSQSQICRMERQALDVLHTHLA